MLVTHDHEEAFAIADRMAVMRDGPDRPDRDPRRGLEPARPTAGRRGFLGYATVLTGEPARRLRELAAPTETWEAVALRRSALRVDPHGPLLARVEEARVTPDQIRVQLDVDGAGSLPGVAEHGQRGPSGRAGARVHRHVENRPGARGPVGAGP